MKTNTLKKFFFLTLVLASASLNAKLLLKPADAIKTLYPESTSSQKRSILLTKSEASTVEKLIKQKLKSKIFTFYIIKKDNEIISYAGVYTNKVRSKTGTFMTFISTEGKITSIEVIAFNEPPEYTPKKRWLELFDGKSVQDNIKVKESVPNLSGATLSATSAANTAKLMLAVWKVKYGK